MAVHPALLPATTDDAARRFGDRPAVVSPSGERVTFRQLAAASERAAAGLHARGVRTGDVVALCLPSSPDHLAAYVGAARLGAATAGVNRRLPPGRRRQLVERLQPTLLVTTEELDPGADVPTTHVRPGGPSAGLLAALDPAAGAGPVPLPPPDPDRPVALVPTSGTTGPAKAAVFTDRQLDAIRRLDAGDRADGGGPVLASTELVHVGMVTKLVWYLRTGVTLHLLDRWRAPDALDVIVREQVPVVGAISAQVALLLGELEAGRAPGPVDHVRALVVGGGPSSPSLVRHAREAFGADYSIRYSSTESGGVGTATAFDAPDEEALHTVGRPRPGVEMEVRRDDGGVAATDEVGRVHLRSAAVMAGWWQDPAATARTLVDDGWLRTDDLGLVDERGCLRLAGRVADTFVRGGHNVHPEQVEAALADHPAVAEVAVVGRPDEVMGTVGVAVVVPVRGAPAPGLAELRAFAAPRLARHELPEDLAVLDRLPRTATDKLDRRAVRARLDRR